MTNWIFHYQPINLNYCILVVSYSMLHSDCSWQWHFEFSINMDEEIYLYLQPLLISCHLLHHNYSIISNNINLSLPRRNSNSTKLTGYLCICVYFARVDFPIYLYFNLSYIGETYLLADFQCRHWISLINIISITAKRFAFWDFPRDPVLNCAYYLR